MCIHQRVEPAAFITSIGVLPCKEKKPIKRFKKTIKKNHQIINLFGHCGIGVLPCIGSCQLKHKTRHQLPPSRRLPSLSQCLCDSDTETESLSVSDSLVPVSQGTLRSWSVSAILFGRNVPNLKDVLAKKCERFGQHMNVSAKIYGFYHRYLSLRCRWVLLRASLLFRTALPRCLCEIDVCPLPLCISSSDAYQKYFMWISSPTFVLVFLCFIFGLLLLALLSFLLLICCNAHFKCTVSLNHCNVAKIFNFLTPKNYKAGSGSYEVN